jgi:TatD DNase family protein
MIDTHCHLDLEQFDHDRAEMIQRAHNAGVRGMVLIGYNPERWRTTDDLCQRYRFMRRSVGLHPNDATMWSSEFESDLIREIERSTPIAVGEIGIDFYRSADNAGQQREAFNRQMEIARDYHLPVIIHQRAAETDVLEVLQRFAPVSGVMHCFTGDASFAAECVRLGMYLGIGGVATFPKSNDIRDAIASVPAERLVLETDAPFLAPQPWRGKRNEPSYLTSVVETLTGVLNISTEEVMEVTTTNAVALFGSSMSEALAAGMENL